MTDYDRSNQNGERNGILFEELAGKGEKGKRSVFRYHNCKTMKRAFEHLSSLLYSVPHTHRMARPEERERWSVD